MERIIGVASNNPVKVSAVTKAAQVYWDDCQIVSFSIFSGVSDMPMSKTETRIGAKNRAIKIQKELECWLGVGNEGGACWVEGDLYLFSTTYVTDGKTGSYGGETLMKLPEAIAKALGNGERELGSIMDEITGTQNVKQKEGAVGYLSQNKITRTDIFELSTKMAFAHWVKDKN